MKTSEKKITVEDVQQWIAKGLLLWAYPKNGQIIRNGGPGKPATPAAITLVRSITHPKKSK